MKVQIIGSTKLGNKLTKEEAMSFAGKAAGICYLPDTIETLFAEPEEKTMRRVNMTLQSGHHSVYDHATYSFMLIDIPKIFAMILNNEKMYTTSEKSGRYTKMSASKEEETLYLKWIDVFSKKIKEVYPQVEDKLSIKLAQENARNLISMFTPATTMEYTVSFRQLNYIMHWFLYFIKEAADTDFNKKLKPFMQDFVDQLKDLFVPELNHDLKRKTISLFAKRKRQEEFGENYSVNYMATAPNVAQALRHRTLEYEISIPEKKEFFVPYIIRGTELEKEWMKDITSLAHLYPQGLLLEVNERGTVENFVLKCQERLCGCAQLEIAKDTKEILEKYIEHVKDTNKEVYEYLKQYNTGARCTFKGFRCSSPCIWGAKQGLDRLI